MPRRYGYEAISTSHLATDFNVAFYTIKAVMDRAGIKPLRVTKTGRSTFYDWPKKTAVSVMEKYLVDRQRKAEEKAAQERLEAEIRAREAQAAEEAAEEAAKAQAVEEAARAEQPVAARPYAPEWDPPVVDLSGMREQLNRIEKLMEQILDAVTSPEGTPR